MQPLTYIVVGAGWRALFYVRIARRWPQCFRLLGMLCRSAEKAEALRREYGVDATADAEKLAAKRPDFVVVAVEKSANAAVAKAWLARGFAVLAETPAAGSEQELAELWALYRAGARLQIAEQYFRYPIVAAGLHAVEQGLLGAPQAATLNLAHDYHGASVLRRALGYRPGDPLPEVRVTGARYQYPVECTDSRQGPVTDGRMQTQTRDRVTLEFADGKLGFYDFSGVAYHSFIRARHINVQGTKGEWNDTTLRRVDAAHAPHTEPLRPRLDPAYAALQDDALRALCAEWHPAVHMEPWQDEYAIATLLLDMAGLVKTNRGGYPLAEALEDAYLWLLMQQACEHPGQTFESRPRPWRDG